jgi:hypothetical protein
MRVNQNLVYIHLKMLVGMPARFIARMTSAVPDGLVVGSVISGVRAGTASFVMESCELTPAEFRAWRASQRLSVGECAGTYRLSVDEVMRYEQEK